ncbi:MAG: PepSY domain-containing protein [Gammaproteobacteria bacterium]|nr:PepSY domain-containing protein [Gammaproteobacteria bacterium]
MNILPPALVKSALGGHKWVGLLCGALMYVVCLSGTLAVFYQEFERWEQANIPESATADSVELEKRFNELLADNVNVTEHMYLRLPTVKHPRTVIANENEGWFVSPDGSLLENVSHDWTHMLIDLHLYLLLPNSFGMIVVSLLGVLLCTLIFTGFLSHPRIFKDAFHFRNKGSRQLEQTDLHNRLSVWGAPFHLMIGMTGAYFGLVGMLVWLVASAVYDGDRQQVLESVFGGEPEVHEQAGDFSIHRVLTDIKVIAPNATPLFITFHNVGESNQFMELYASQPGRLIYSENYSFDTAGNYLGKDGFSDGEIGKQLVYSIYRLHFGNFAGLPVKVIYLLLGFALTLVSVSGINIWLSKRKVRDQINVIWSGIVWGLPVALTASAIS